MEWSGLDWTGLDWSCLVSERGKKGGSIAEQMKFGKSREERAAPKGGQDRTRHSKANPNVYLHRERANPKKIARTWIDDTGMGWY